MADKRAAKVAQWSQLEDRTPAYALVADVDLVVVRYDDDVSVFYGRCLHRGALLSDGHVDGQNLIFRRDEIDTMHAIKRSVMPEGTLQPLEDQQVRDLMAYLRSSQPVNY